MGHSRICPRYEYLRSAFQLRPRLGVTSQQRSQENTPQAYKLVVHTRYSAEVVKINGFGGFLLHLFNHRFHRFTRILFSHRVAQRTQRDLLGFGVPRQAFSPPKGCERPLPCPPKSQRTGLPYDKPSILYPTHSLFD